MSIENPLTIPLQKTNAPVEYTVLARGGEPLILVRNPKSRATVVFYSVLGFVPLVTATLKNQSGGDDLVISQPSVGHVVVFDDLDPKEWNNPDGFLEFSTFHAQTDATLCAAWDRPKKREKDD